MKDPILVRVTLDSYDFAHPGEKQTQVYVQIPEVARASYMLPAERFHGLVDRAWPEVLDVAHEHYARGWLVTDSTSAAARRAVADWLRDDANRDEMQAAWEQDQARRHPVARRLLAENERLRGQLAGEELAYERLRVALESAKRGRREARARVAELLAERHTTNEALSSAAETLRENRDRIADLEAQRDRRRERLVAAEADLLEMRGLFSPNGQPRRIPAEVEIHERVAPAVEWLLNRVAELEQRLSTARTEAIADVGDWLDEHGEKNASHLVYTCDIPAARDMKVVATEDEHAEAGESA
ncbi:hypothetical protein L0F81_23695 [Streptomyces tricolor]|uniref:Uncharacterized protein n=1 Tax=Streptomyces tricolor TaxID=68277 RepID=A0ABS9JL11_9ACTN|nr:hypothetical protein [Streptomyces tricolor]MCG0066257.1 hypothetical protein [Streptomyces tricolor]